MQLHVVQAASILTRTSGYLSTIVSHSLNPYVGCALGRSLCGVGCYVRHNPWITRGREWGTFVEAKANADALYCAEWAKERRWARRTTGRFAIFLASSTEPFQPAERRLGVTRSLLRAMLDRPPDVLIVQSHSPRVLDVLGLLCELKRRCDLRVHISIETDREALPGLPRHASPVSRRIDAGRALRGKGVFAVATLSPLLPIDRPDAFLGELARAFDAIVIDHFVGGDGSRGGLRTRRTALPAAMARLDPLSLDVAYRDDIVRLARRHFARVGVGCDGFGGKWIKRSSEPLEADCAQIRFTRTARPV